jgi:hypothetical protein
MTTMKLKFSTDKWYDGKLLYKKDTVYEVETALGWAARWIKRGGEEVQDEPAAQVEEVSPEEKCAEECMGILESESDIAGSEEVVSDAPTQEEEEEVVIPSPKFENKRARKSSK